MEIQEDICHFCSLETRVISNEKSFVKIIKKVLSNEVLNYPEYSKVKSKLKPCLLCAHKLLQIEKTRVKIENATVNKHFNCFLCNEDQNLVQIQDWDDLNNLLDALDCKAKKKKFKLCLECFYFLKSIDEVKNNLFMHFPILKVNKTPLPIKQEYEMPEKARPSPSKSPPKITPTIKKKATQIKTQVKADDKLSPKIPLILLRQENLTKLQEESKRQWNLVESESPQPNKIAKLTLRRTAKVPESVEERKSGRRRSLPAKISAEVVESPRPGRRKSLETPKKLGRKVGRKLKAETPVKQSIRIRMKIPEIVISDDEEEIPAKVGRKKRKLPDKKIVEPPKKKVESPKKTVEKIPKKRGRKSNKERAMVKAREKQLMVKLQQLQFNEDGSPVVKKRKSVTFNDDNLVQYFPSENGDDNEKPKKARKKIVYPKEKIVSDIVIPDDEESDETEQLNGEPEKTPEEPPIEPTKEKETEVCDKEIEESQKRPLEDSQDLEESAKRQCMDQITLESVSESLPVSEAETPQPLNDYSPNNEEPEPSIDDPKPSNDEPQPINEDTEPINQANQETQPITENKSEPEPETQTTEDSQATSEEESQESTPTTIDVDKGLNEIVDHIAKECIAPNSKIVILHQNIFNAVEETDSDLKNTNGKSEDQTMENGLKLPFNTN